MKTVTLDYQEVMADTRPDSELTRDQVVARNLAVVEAHFHNENPDDVDKAVGLYTDDISWEAPSRGLVYTDPEQVLAGSPARSPTNCGARPAVVKATTRSRPARWSRSIPTSTSPPPSSRAVSQRAHGRMAPWQRVHEARDHFTPRVAASAGALRTNGPASALTGEPQATEIRPFRLVFPVRSAVPGIAW
jgi:hypothetical protein